jgi:hypothetical protein
MPSRIYLTDEQCERARLLWAGGQAAHEVAAAIGVTFDTFRARMADQLADLPPRSRAMTSGRRGEDPSPDQIRVRTAMLRRSWPDERFFSVECTAERLGRLAKRA